MVTRAIRELIGDLRSYEWSKWSVKQKFGVRCTVDCGIFRRSGKRGVSEIRGNRNLRTEEKKEKRKKWKWINKKEALLLLSWQVFTPQWWVDAIRGMGSGLYITRVIKWRASRMGNFILTNALPSSTRWFLVQKFSSLVHVILEFNNLFIILLFRVLNF